MKNGRVWSFLNKGGRKMYTVHLRLHLENGESREWNGTFVVNAISFDCSSIMKGYLQGKETGTRMLLCGYYNSYFRHLNAKRTLMMAIPLNTEEVPFHCVTEDLVSGKWYYLGDKTSRVAEIRLQEEKEKWKTRKEKERRIRELYREMFSKLPEPYNFLCMGTDYTIGLEEEEFR